MGNLTIDGYFSSSEVFDTILIIISAFHLSTAHKNKVINNQKNTQLPVHVFTAE